VSERDVVRHAASSQDDVLGPLDLSKEQRELARREQEYRRALTEIEHEVTALCPEYLDMVHLVRRYASSHLSATGPKVIGVASANAGEGRTTVALGLASALSEIHERVIFVEAETSSGRSLQAQLTQRESIGLSGFLSQKVTVEQSVDPTTKNGLWLLPAGRLSTELTQLEAVGGMRTLLSQLRQDFDAVVVDLPPFLVSEGAAALVPELDSVILVVAAGQTTMSEVAATVRLCGSVVLDGVFLNKAVYKTPRWLASLLGIG
jgi:Mrp family chromosome partitioning ATPase